MRAETKPLHDPHRFLTPSQGTIHLDLTVNPTPDDIFLRFSVDLFETLISTGDIIFRITLFFVEIISTYKPKFCYANLGF